MLGLLSLPALSLSVDDYLFHNVHGLTTMSNGLTIIIVIIIIIVIASVAPHKIA